MPDFVPISSCDIDPPDFDSPSDLKISQNFGKLITNAKKVDKFRLHAQRASQVNPSTTVQDVIKKQETLGHTVTLEEAQKRLIEQLKQGLHYLTLENKELGEQRTQLEAQLAEEKESVEIAKNEVIERNLKLAVLEHHFKTINDHHDNDEVIADGDYGTDANSNVDDDKAVDGGSEPAEAATASASAADEIEGGDKDDNEKKDKSKPVPPKIPVAPTASSSIIQIDKGYYRELEAKAKREKAEREKMEQVNQDLAMKYAILEKDSEKKIEDMKRELEDNAMRLESQLNRQERTIESLEKSLTKSRALLFKKDKKSKKSHRRRATVNNIPSPDDIPSSTNAEEDEQSVSVTTMDHETETETESQSEQDVLQKTFVKEAVASAVKEATDAQEVEHKTFMTMLSKQLELKDKHINSLESKIFGLLKHKNDRASPQRSVRKDDMVRSMVVTNEMLDTSMRKLENMMVQIQKSEEDKKKNATTADGSAVSEEGPMAPVRRVATKISLVHEEMKVSMKLFEQKIQNVEEMKEEGKGKNDSEAEKEQDSNEESEQTSGEDGEASSSNSSEQSSLVELIEDIKKALKQTESSMKEEIGKLKDHVQNIEFDMAANVDTIEALEMACTEHLESYRALQKDYEELKERTEGEDEEEL
jgi:uncharacterized coiled-coil protein SlyX